MEPAGRGERALRLAQALGKRGDDVQGDLERALDARSVDPDRFDRTLPAHAAGRRGVEVPPEAIGIEASGVDLDGVGREVFGHARGRRREALRDAEPERELLVVSGRTHRHRHGLTADPDLERLLDGDEVVLRLPTGKPQRLDAAGRIGRRVGRLAAHTASVLSAPLCSPLRFGADAVERRRHGRLPRTRHGGAPEPAQRPEIGSELTRVHELGVVADLGEYERLDDVWDGAANEAEVDTLRTLEADRLDRRRRQPVGARVVSRENHVLAALEHLDLRA